MHKEENIEIVILIVAEFSEPSHIHHHINIQFTYLKIEFCYILLLHDRIFDYMEDRHSISVDMYTTVIFVIETGDISQDEGIILRVKDASSIAKLFHI